MRCISLLLAICAITILGLSACKSSDRSTARAPDGKFRVAFVYVGPIGDAGWTYAHDLARRELLRRLDFLETTYVENVSGGAEAVQVINNLARKGYDLIITTSFGFMDATEESARLFPNVKFLNITGFKSNGSNFGNLMGAIEEAKYLAGMIAGARAMDDARLRVGYIAPFPIAEVIRLVNAFALGVRKTCSACVIEIRWTNSWFDPPREKEAADSLLQAGVDVVATGADTPSPVVTAAQAGRWGIGYDSPNACRSSPERCLTVPYWNWAPAYEKIIHDIREGRFKGTNDYQDMNSGVIGLVGFMPGETPAPGVPTWVVPLVRERLARMRAGSLTRFDLFAGPLKNNQGVTVIPAGKRPTQEDLEGLKGVAGRPDCTICMNWLVEGIHGRLSTGN